MQSPTSELYTLLPVFLSSFVQSLPILVVIFVGILISFSKLTNYPKAKQMVLIGLFILLFRTILGMIISSITPLIYSAYRENVLVIGYVVTTVWFIVAVVQAVGLIILVSAVWADRR